MERQKGASWRKRGEAVHRARLKRACCVSCESQLAVAEPSISSSTSGMRTTQRGEKVPWRRGAWYGSVLSEILSEGLRGSRSRNLSGRLWVWQRLRGWRGY